MGDPLILPAVLSAGGTALQAGGQVMAGRERSRAAMTQSREAVISAQLNRIAGLQEETLQREDLTSSLETIQAIRVGRGVGEASPTGLAILDEIVARGDASIRTGRLNRRQDADASRRAAARFKTKGRTSLLSGFLQGGSTVFTSGASIYQSFLNRPSRKSVPLPTRNPRRV